MIRNLILVAVLAVCAVVLRTHIDTHRDWGEASADCAVVLGCLVEADGTPSTSLKNRCVKAAEAYHAGRVPSIIVCGGQAAGEPCAEADVMRKTLLDMGVPAEAIITDDTSRNTRENLGNARAIMEERSLKNALIVTSDYHVRRALWLARDCGIEAYGCAAPGPSIPHVKVKALLRESVSRMKYFFEARRK